jgi:transglutaminase-like putative cysteine protease
MLLRLTHTTTYRYSEPVRFGRHRLVIRPREGHDVRVESLVLTIRPAHQLAWMRDVFGNSVALVDFLEQADTLRIQSDVALLRHPPTAPGADPRLAAQVPGPVPFPVVYDPLESAVAAAYRATTYGEDAEAVRGYLSQHGLLAPDVAAGETGAEGLLDRINQTLHGTIGYGKRPEKGTQTPAVTLSRKSGSCRDLATLMMEACRTLGIAARFASGYLDCPASTAGTASTHAWMEAYLPPHGWVGFDPTLGERTSHKHITCGLSNHPRGVMPVSGTYGPTGTSQYLGLTVAVQIAKG